MKTEFVNPDKLERRWHLIDAKDKVLGKVASEAARILRGKDSVKFNPGHDIGDFVLVINAAEIVLTGKKWDNKTYYHHTGYVGGIYGETANKRHARKPTALIEMAVQGMLPKGPLGRKMLKKLHVYPTHEHPHQAQKPAPHPLPN
jgi:large subunit ribosomal protein L13